MLTSLQQSNRRVKELVLNSDFDKVSFRNGLFKHDIFVNIENNKRNGKNDVSFLDEALCNKRFVVERTNAWLDAFKVILVRFETRKMCCKALLAYHCVLYRFLNFK